MTAGPPAPGALPGPGDPLRRAAAVMDRLRSPGGCPWDGEQTHASLARYLVEETYEVLEAIDTDDPALLREELGDVLLQVLFHARLAQERTDGAAFDIDDVAADAAAKMIRRHPHVFAPAHGAAPPSAQEVSEGWEQLKSREKARASLTDGVPMGLPALALAAKLVSRARLVGLADIVARAAAPDPTAGAAAPDPIAGAASPDPTAVGAAAPASGGDAGAQERIGAALLGVVAEAEAAGIDPEDALRQAARRLRAELIGAERAGAQ
jgi:XTP/dITP diphosphohydrolase